MGIRAQQGEVPWRRAFAWAALATLVAGSLAIVLYAAAGPSPLVAGSVRWPSFPAWLAGPLHGVLGHPKLRTHALDDAFSALIVAMTVAYFVVLWSGRSLSGRTIAVFIVLVEGVLLLGPPLQLTDVFNYLAYARLGALHGLNPYTHVVDAEQHDPIYGFSTWHDWRSPYGTLFTALTYPLGVLPLPLAYWVLKLVTVFASFAFVWLVWRCAQLLGHDPRRPALVVAANPIYLIYGVGEFHNDFFMLTASMGAIALLLGGRYRSAGAALAAAVAIKVTMILLLPFLLVAAWRRRAAGRLLVGLAIGAVPLVALSLIMFGPVLPNVAGQSQLLTGFSVPNLLGWAIGLGGGTPQLVRGMNALIVVVVGYQLLRRRDWLSGAGWATLALLASLGWLMPWYLIWLLPLAALAPSVELRRVSLLATVFVLITFLPVTSLLLRRLEINPSAGPVGIAAYRYQWDAQHWRPHLVPPWMRSELRREQIIPRTSFTRGRISYQ